MESTFPINYRAGWMESANEYIPEVIPPKPQWQTTNRLLDYGPVVEDDYQPRNHIKEPTRTYQKMQYTKPFPTKNPIMEFVNETIPLDLPNNDIITIYRYRYISSLSISISVYVYNKNTKRTISTVLYSP